MSGVTVRIKAPEDQGSNRWTAVADVPQGRSYTYSTIGWSVWVDSYSVKGSAEASQGANWHNMFDLRCRVASVAYRLGYWLGNRIDPTTRHFRP